MNKLLGFLLVIILFVVGFELFFFLTIKPKIKTANNVVLYPTITNIKTDWESWTPSEIRTYSNKTYGDISLALVKVNKVIGMMIDAELKNKKKINFQYDQSLEYYDRKELQGKTQQKRNLDGFTIEIGKIYLVEWLEKSKDINKLWRISRLIE